MSKFFTVILFIIEIWPELKRMATSAKSGFLHIQRRRKDKAIVALFQEGEEDETVQETIERTTRLNDLFK